MSTAQSLTAHSVTIPPLRSRRLLDRAAAPSIAALYVAVIALFYPHDQFSRNPDEGYNAMKALLVDHDFRLYADIWSDQPPLFTHLLRAWFDLFGADIGAGRFLVLLFAALLLFAVYDLTQRCWNHFAALAAVVLLAVSTYFVDLSISLMIGIPSLACAMLSLWALLRWRLDSRAGWLALSGALMAMSLGIKLFTAFLPPAFAIWLIFVSWLEGRPRPWRPALAWLAVVAAVAAILFLGCSDAGALHQEVQPHIAARSLDEMARWHGYDVLWRLVPLDAPLVLLAAIGTVLIAQRRCWNLLPMPLWAGTALLLLLTHTPVWFHHYLLLTTPAAPCAGVAIAAMLGARRRGDDPDRSPAPAALRIAAVLSLLVFIHTFPMSRRALQPTLLTEWEGPRQVLAVMKRYAGATKLVLTDFPMFAFRADLLCVPELAVVSTKRARTGNLQIADVLDGLTRHAPEQVLLADRFPSDIRAALVAAMNERYTMVYNGAGRPPVQLYIRTDILQLTAAARAGAGSGN